MESFVVGVATGAVNPLLSKLSKLLEEEYRRYKTTRRDVRSMESDMRTMRATLELLADEEELNPQMRIWRDAVRELSYDMEDCVDDFIAHVDHEPGEIGIFKKIGRKFTDIKTRHAVAGQLRELKARATEESERHKRYAMVPTHNAMTRLINPHVSANFVDASNLVGIDGPKEHLIERLTKHADEIYHAKLGVVSIVGQGGLGKTTLARQVYETIQHKFSAGAFVSVSRKTDMKKTLADIADAVGIISPNDDEHRLITRLREHLKDKRYLIVIDDLWTSEVWDSIKFALVDNNLGSRIMTTTRNMEVASHCSGYVYQMKSLSIAESRRLCFKRAFGYEELDSSHSHLEKVSVEILTKCGGLPLAIITVASLLADKHAQSEWERVRTAIGSELARNPNAENLTKILSLSYLDLPRKLQTCLLYLSMFPQGYIVHKQRLICRWIAEGFVHEEQGRSAYEVGEGYFNELINRSLLQAVHLNCGQAQACRVHDIILDFISRKATEENFVTTLNDLEHTHSPEYRVRRLLVENPNTENVNVLAGAILSHVRSLTLLGHFMQDVAAFSALRVLDSAESWGLTNHHLVKICKLIHLKYLRLGQHTITELPKKIGELRYLETLDIRCTKIQTLPSTIKRLHRLARLYVDQDTRFPSGTIGHMKSLQDVEKFGVFSSEQGKSLQEFTRLANLRRLTVFYGIIPENQFEGPHYLAILLSSCNLYDLHIHTDEATYQQVSLESWCHTAPSSLQKLHIACFAINRVPNWMRLHGNLRELSLFIFSIGAEDVEILGSIPALVSLKLRTMCGTNGKILICGFRSLKYFYQKIDLCGTSLEFEVGSVPKLEDLQLEFCVHNSQCLNGARDFGIQHLSTLATVEIIIGCELEEDNIEEIVVQRIQGAIETLPNRPTLLVKRTHEPCRPFTEHHNQNYGASTSRIGS